MGPARDARGALFGRHDECAMFDGSIAGARAGHSQVLVLRGEAGITRLQVAPGDRPSRSPGLYLDSSPGAASRPIAIGR